jgi:hypothetical protein
MYLLSFDFTDPETWLFIGIIVFLILALLFYVIIKVAVKEANHQVLNQAEVQNFHLANQVRLLALMAEKSGVNKKEINEIMGVQEEVQPSSATETTSQQNTSNG